MNAYPSSRVRQVWPRSIRLSGKSTVRSLFQSGQRHRGQFLVIYHRSKMWCAEDGECAEANTSRYLIAISKKVGTAPMRNRMRRLIREVLRLDFRWQSGGKDMVVLMSAYPKGISVTLSAIRSELDQCFLHV